MTDYYRLHLTKHRCTLSNGKGFKKSLLQQPFTLSKRLTLYPNGKRQIHLYPLQEYHLPMGGRVRT